MFKESLSSDIYITSIHCLTLNILVPHLPTSLFPYLRCRKESPSTKIKITKRLRKKKKERKGRNVVKNLRNEWNNRLTQDDFHPVANRRRLHLSYRRPRNKQRKDYSPNPLLSPFSLTHVKKNQGKNKTKIKQSKMKIKASKSTRLPTILPYKKKTKKKIKNKK